MPMVPLYTRLTDLAARETRTITVGPAPSSEPGQGTPAGQYAYLEFYCNHLNCDCRRTFIQVVPAGHPEKVLASINFGWESDEFYRKKMSYDPSAPRLIVRGSLDPINPQSEHAEDFLDLFQRFVVDEPYRIRLKRHYMAFREHIAAERKKSR